ncbi:MarC family protein [Herminiimonas fonticola]|uniref:MarC family protein n=1 Tax=Herminiimonas fonticola TaxID=303380 RepID=UPI0033418CF0
MLILFFKAAILIPITLVPILNPFGNAPIFASLAGNIGRDAEKRLANQVAINCFVMLLGAMFIGSHVLMFFGISLPIVRIGGGILVAATGWRLLNDNGQDAIRTQVASKPGEVWSEDDFKVRSFYPISFPLTVGPGAIAASITLGASAPSRLSNLLISIGSAALGAAMTALVIFLCYRYANKMVSLLGRLGTMVVLRLSAFILLCIGIEIFWQGMLGLLTEANILTS